MSIQAVREKMKDVSIREEKDYRQLRILNMSLIGLLLGSDIVLLAFSIVLFQSLGGAFKISLLIIVAGCILVFMVGLGVVGTYAMYKRLLTAYAIAVFVLAVLFFSGFILIFNQVNSNNQSNLHEKCLSWQNDLDKSSPLKDGDCEDYVDLLTDFSYLVSVVAFCNSIVMLGSAYVSILLSYSVGAI